jgi:hypothetical protein
MGGDECERELEAQGGSEREEAEPYEGREENEAGHDFHDGSGLREMTGFTSQSVLIREKGSSRPANSGDRRLASSAGCSIKAAGRG